MSSVRACDVCMNAVSVFRWRWRVRWFLVVLSPLPPRDMDVHMYSGVVSGRRPPPDAPQGSPGPQHVQARGRAHTY